LASPGFPAVAAGFARSGDRGCDATRRSDQVATAASSRSISAAVPIGFGRKSTAPALTAATAVLSDPRALVAISDRVGPAISPSFSAPPIVSRSAITMALAPSRETPMASAGLLQTRGEKRPTERSAIAPARARHCAGSASTMKTSTGSGEGRPRAMTE
jgi:hypothetical protein